jgi:hypothetical protein
MCGANLNVAKRWRQKYVLNEEAGVNRGDLANEWGQTN